MSIVELLLLALLVYFGQGQAHRAFPVLSGGALRGIVDCGMLARALRTPGATVGSACEGSVLHFALPGENCRTVATRMARYRLERLPVVSDAASMSLVGIVSRSDLIKPSIVHFDEEENRERLRSMPWRSQP